MNGLLTNYFYLKQCQLFENLLFCLRNLFKVSAYSIFNCIPRSSVRQQNEWNCSVEEDENGKRKRRRVQFHN